MGLFDADGDDGYDRSDEDDDFVSWSNKKRAEASPPPVDDPRPKSSRRTLTERLADAATDRENASDTESPEH
jgi:hypothetical protein